MQNEDTPLYRHKIEHQFADSETEQTISIEEHEREVRDAEKRGARQERFKIRREAKKKAKVRIVGTLCIVAMIYCFSLLYKFLTSIYSSADQLWFGTAVSAVLTMIGKIILDEKKFRTYRKADEVFFQGAWNGFVELIKFASRNNLLAFLLILDFGIVLGGLTGRFDVLKRLELAFQCIIYYDKEEYGEWHAEEVAEERISEEALKVLEEYEGDPEEIKQIEIYPNEVDLVLNLSDEERGIVFFTQGEYKITDWEDQEEINTTVLRMVENARKEGFTNQFDDFAPQDVKDEIDKVSKDEMTAEHFSEVKDIKTVRADVYTVYPKRSIANLISNGNQKLALILLCHNGRQETILYYYSQSILWDIEFIKYEDISNSTVKDHLTKIAQRYKDINMVCPACAETEYAEKLQIAFENAADYY